MQDGIKTKGTRKASTENCSRSECQLAQTLCAIKVDLDRTYDGTAQIQEAVPSSTSEFAAPQDDLDMLHKFISENPIYYNSYEDILAGIKCTVYEGDINRYWLGSIGHAESHAPFSPTWVSSAYVLALFAWNMGCTEAIDVGSGDGRIAFCSQVAGMKSHSIEIDTELAELQRHLTPTTLKTYCHDATTFNYSTLKLERPAVFIGGLAQMGGTRLAASVIDGLAGMPDLTTVELILAGTYSPKYTTDPLGMCGWGTLIEKSGFMHDMTVDLPTMWTLHEADCATPYVFAARR